MSAITVPIPGTEYLCDCLCRHKDCAQHHADAAALCFICSKRIGYATPWLKQENGPVHFDCADEKRGGPSR
ncbi:MAG: hypothetical protein V4510_09940 [bacterium]